MRVLFTLICLWLLVLPAAAQVRVISSDVEAASVTIYPDNLALITEVRRVNVPAGRSTLAFEGVSDLIIPQSMILREFSGFTLERNFDYDLLGKVSLFEKSIGKIVTLTRLDKASGAITNTQATIISARRDTGVVVDVEGKTEVLMCSGLSERTQFEGLPAGLNPAPVMSIVVNAETAGEQEVVISYLTSGLGWQADYRLDINEAQDQAAMLGWLTLTNNTAKRYEDVTLSIIAGDLNRRPETRAVSSPKPYQRAQCYPKGSTKRGIASRIIANVSKTMARGQSYGLTSPVPEMAMMADSVVVTGTRSAKQAVEETVGDYKLFRVPGEVSVGAYQTKQIAFLNKDTVDINPYYKAEIYGQTQYRDPIALEAMFDIDNSRDGLLAASLPKGVVRFFGRNKTGRLVFLGDDRIDNLAIDEPVRLSLGASFNVHMRGDMEVLRRKSGDYQVAKAVFQFFNAFDTPTRVKLIVKDQKLRGDMIEMQSHNRDDNEIDPTWWVEVEPESQATLTFGVGTEMIYKLDLDPLAELTPSTISDISQDLQIEGQFVLKGTQSSVQTIGFNEGLHQISDLSAVTLISDVESVLRDDSYVTQATITHAIKNPGPHKKTFTIAPLYEDPLEGNFKLIESSIRPKRRGEPNWTLSLEAGEDLVLTYQVEIFAP